MIDVPESLRKIRTRCWAYPFPGPKLEDYFYARWKQEQPKGLSRQYLPIFWTHLYTAKKSRTAQIQAALDRVKAPAFTIVQHDSGAFRNEVPANLLTFAAGGVGDIAVPLVYDFLPAVAGVERKHFAYFSGRITSKSCNTHRVRTRMRNRLAKEPGFVIHDTYRQSRLWRPAAGGLSRCIFALCPRGYGKTSFRLYEAMTYGAIPVYIYDELWLPYADRLRWEEFSVLCHVDDLDGLAGCLRTLEASGAVPAMQARLREVVPAYFTLDAVFRQVCNILQ